MLPLALIALILVSVLCVAFGGAAPGSDIQTPTGAKLLSQGPKGSSLYSLSAPNSVYGDAPYVLDLTTSSSYNQGFDTGYLLGVPYVENYDSLMKALLGDAWWEPAVASQLGKFLDWQWREYLSVQVPQEYLDELKGMTDGGYAAGLKEDVGAIAGWGITLANFPGTIPNIKFVLADEKTHPATKKSLEKELEKYGLTVDSVKMLLEKLRNNWSGLTCSMFGVWGSRTENGKIFTGRNLDWLKDSGISKYKLVTLHRPPNGNAHATFGWAGIWGAITGISAKGITVHEANLESNDITFRGFPWVLRLRHVMAYAQNLDEALNIWSNTNSTVGFNHGFGSAADKKMVVLETMMGNSAVFGANDSREKDLVVYGQQIGQAREEAVFRTNHGYDSYTIEHYMWNGTSAYNNSILRYMVFPEMFDMYQQQKTAITYVEAVNITAVLGEKGDEHTYDCTTPMQGASNILSVTYDPAELVAYAAWENGHGSDSWMPAACNTYLVIDFKPWFSGSKH